MGTLGGRDSHAFDVNRQGEIVGLSSYWHRSPEKRKQLAFLFKDGQMRSLNSLADVGDRNLFYVYAINDDGDIVGNMGVPRAISQLRAFLLRPIPQ